MRLVNNTRKIDEIDIKKYDAIVIAGGQGPMFEYDRLPSLWKIFSEFYVQPYKIASAICHGTSVLTYAKLPNGEYLIKGLRATGFSNLEEDATDEYLWKYNVIPQGTPFVPWRVQDGMVSRGAIYSQGPYNATGPLADYAVTDGKLVTGQQQASGRAFVSHLLDALKAQFKL